MTVNHYKLVYSLIARGLYELINSSSAPGCHSLLHLLSSTERLRDTVSRVPFSFGRDTC